ERLLAVVGERVGAGRAEGRAARVREREQPPPGVALGGDGGREAVVAAGADLDLGEDQLARDRAVEHGVRSRRLAQLLEARGERERPRIEDRELLLEADGEVRRGLEHLAGLSCVDAHY